MRHETRIRTRHPKIVVSETDHERLTELALAALDRLPEIAEELLAEMDRAKIVRGDAVPAGVVRMGSTVTFQTEDAHETRVTLVWPAQADFERGRLSIMTPVGTALIGLSEGQSIEWTARDGRRHHLTVRKVEVPATAA
jgi:regulator of nucleoside diphosphate kinase